MSKEAKEKHSVTSPTSLDDVLLLAVTDDSPLLRFFFEILAPTTYEASREQCKRGLFEGAPVHSTIENMFLTSYMLCEVLRFASSRREGSGDLQNFIDILLLGVPENVCKVFTKFHLASSSKKRLVKLLTTGADETERVESSVHDPYSVIIATLDNVGYYFKGSTPGYLQAVLSGCALISREVLAEIGIYGPNKLSRVRRPRSSLKVEDLLPSINDVTLVRRRSTEVVNTLLGSFVSLPDFKSIRIAISISNASALYSNSEGANIIPTKLLNKAYTSLNFVGQQKEQTVFENSEGILTDEERAELSDVQH